MWTITALTAKPCWVPTSVCRARARPPTELPPGGAPWLPDPHKPPVAATANAAKTLTSVCGFRVFSRPGTPNLHSSNCARGSTPTLSSHHTSAQNTLGLLAGYFCWLHWAFLRFPIQCPHLQCLQSTQLHPPRLTDALSAGPSCPHPWALPQPPLEARCTVISLQFFS